VQGKNAETFRRHAGEACPSLRAGGPGAAQLWIDHEQPRERIALRIGQFGFVMMLALSSAQAQTRDENWAKCIGRDPEIIIAGCTAVTEEAQRATADQAIAFDNRGMAYGKRNLNDQAIADFTKAILLNPDLVDAWYNRGNAFYRKGLVDQAIDDYTRAVAVQSGLVVG
jgi:tetratricopeptide (TPR) repeat protein